jgi:release factor glutamine methyltransferase
LIVRPAEVVRRAAGYLERHDVESPLVNAELLLGSVLGLDRTALYRRTEGLSTSEARLFGRALCRRCVGTPLQHITGEQGFRRLILGVRPDVFVPRPETETVVQVGLDAVRATPSPLVLDLGTGTGAIALAIADEHPGAGVFAIDRSPAAVSLAAENAARLRLDITVVQGDLWAGAPPELHGLLDLVIANPPYVEPEDLANLPVDVRADPHAALVGGIAAVREWIGAAPEWLRSGGTAVTEIGESQGAEVAAIAQEIGLVDVHVHRDPAGRDRAVSGRKP